MKEISDIGGDDRNKGFCVHCGGPNETRDHAPSKVLLDKPYPANLPILPSCKSCNQGFAADEAYLACFVECVICGTTDPERVSREKVRKILSGNQNLRADIESRRREQPSLFEGEPTDLSWIENADRIQNVIVKLARCHAAFEQNEPQLDEPSQCFFAPLMTFNSQQRDDFETFPNVGGFAGWPEVGSRMMSRVLTSGDESFHGGWLIVQDGRYRYMAPSGGHIRGVLSEYLAYEVIWD